MKKIDRIEEDVIKISSDVCLSDIYSQIGDYELLVEPLSKKQSISEFIYEGGMGFNSLIEGSLASKIFKLKGMAFGKEFEYGLGYHTLYNVGYPLHRMMSRKGSFRGAVGSITELLLPIQPRRELEIAYINKDIAEAEILDGVTNVMYVNNFGAQLMGLKEQGIVATYLPGFYSKNKLENGIWEKRFIEDEIPTGQAILKLLTIPSNTKKLYEMFGEKGDSLFIALFTNKGPVVVISAEESKVKDVSASVSSYPMTYLIRW